MTSDWVGSWKGTVDLWAFYRKSDTFPISLDIQSQDTALSFTINYAFDPEKPDIRKYQLIKIDSVNAHLAIDEQNSIVLASFLNDT